jgi:hypothetical protein
MLGTTAVIATRIVSRTIDAKDDAADLEAQAAALSGTEVERGNGTAIETAIDPGTGIATGNEGLAGVTEVQSPNAKGGIEAVVAVAAAAVARVNRTIALKVCLLATWFRVYLPVCSFWD